MVKNFGGKKLQLKDCFKGLAKTLANVDLHCQSSINNKTKLNEAISNINEHNKMSSIFSRI